MILDYETLKVIWWLFVGVLLIGFAVTGGFDMGVGTLLPFVGRSDAERRVVINTIGPTWDGNQVWLITAGGAIFAAWPLVYAAAFSGFYVALILTLFALILRPVGFEFRSKIADPRWRATWDWGLFVGGAVPAIVFGVAFGNLLQGVPFRYDDTMRVSYSGGFFGLLNPFGLIAGVLSLAMLVMHGGTYLQLRTDGEILARARRYTRIAAILVIVLFAAAGLWVATSLGGYRITQMPDAGGVFTPLAKTVERAAGAWMQNYGRYPWMWLAPAAGLAGAVLAVVLRGGTAFLASGSSVAGIILTAGFSMFPFVMPSSLDPRVSLTAWDAVSSHRTLQIMFWVVVIMLPVVIVYTGWVYSVLRGKVTVERVREQTHTAY